LIVLPLENLEMSIWTILVIACYLGILVLVAYCLLCADSDLIPADSFLGRLYTSALTNGKYVLLNKWK
jgi:hypothetical protein